MRLSCLSSWNHLFVFQTKQQTLLIEVLNSSTANLDTKNISHHVRADGLTKD